MKRFLKNCESNTRGVGARLFVLSLLAAGAIMLSPNANATALTLGACPAANPGDTVLPCDATGTAAGTLLASTSQPFTTPNGTDTGTLLSAVYQEAGGTLDFYYQVTNNVTSTVCGRAGEPTCDPLSRETDTDFVNTLVQLDYRTDGSSLPGGLFVDGVEPPVTGDFNSPTGDVVGYSFFPPDSAKIEPGTSSNVLEISTNATMYQAGTAAVIDGSTVTVASFEPASGVPEPATFAFVGLGLLALGGVRRHFKRSV